MPLTSTFIAVASGRFGRNILPGYFGTGRIRDWKESLPLCCILGYNLNNSMIMKKYAAFSFEIWLDILQAGLHEL
jgi:hypothetical protein